MPANDNSNTLLKAKTTMLTLYSFYMASVDGGANAGAILILVLMLMLLQGPVIVLIILMPMLNVHCSVNC